MKLDQRPPAIAELDRRMREFVRESRVRVALLISRNGRVLAQHGFTRAFEVANVAALAAAAHATANVLAELCSVGRWRHLHHIGRERQFFLRVIPTGNDAVILVAIFDSDSSLGLVRLFADRLAGHIADLEILGENGRRGTAESLDQELQTGLDQAFRAAPGEVG